MDTREIISFYLDNGVLISPELSSDIQDVILPRDTEFTVINKDILDIILRKITINIPDLEKAIVLKEKHHDPKVYNRFLEFVKESSSPTVIRPNIINTVSTAVIDEPVSSAAFDRKVKKPDDRPVENMIDDTVGSAPMVDSPSIDSTDSTSSSLKTLRNAANAIIDEKDRLSREEFMRKNKIRIVSNYTKKAHKWFVQDFVGLYNARYRELEKILRARTELQNLTSISRINGKSERENIALIGLVYEKAVTKAGNLMFTVEDPTGFVKVVVNHKKEDLFKLAEEIQLDEMIGVTGMCDQIVFANNILIPDVPLTKELKKSPEEGYFVLIADTQVGNKLFLEKEFKKLLAWLNGEIGNDRQREVASKVKYIFIAGDLVEGVGIYPDQEYDLAIIDIRKQYEAVADLLKEIPAHIPIIFCLGNHDVGRMSEPQPPLTGEYAQPLLDLPNVISLSNPSTINIYAQPEKGFEGLDVMLYHGGSFFYILNNVLSIRRNGAYKRSDLVMKYILQRRHLAPTHTSTLYIPDPKADPLVIDKVPDFLFSGHIHRATVNNYRNVTCINASCWSSKSPEQERRGLEPQPARAFIIDMQTREVKIMNFLSKEEQEKESADANGVKEPLVDPAQEPAKEIAKENVKEDVKDPLNGTEVANAAEVKNG
jgi:DNA polymerase II small subunit